MVLAGADPPSQFPFVAQAVVDAVELQVTSAALLDETMVLLSSSTESSDEMGARPSLNGIIFIMLWILDVTSILGQVRRNKLLRTELSTWKPAGLKV